LALGIGIRQGSGSQCSGASAGLLRWWNVPPHQVADDRRPHQRGVLERRQHRYLGAREGGNKHVVRDQCDQCHQQQLHDHQRIERHPDPGQQRAGDDAHAEVQRKYQRDDRITPRQLPAGNEDQRVDRGCAQHQQVSRQRAAPARVDGDHHATQADHHRAPTVYADALAEQQCRGRSQYEGAAEEDHGRIGQRQ
jgi:hypothetical protein